MDIILVSIFFILGLIIGSFLNVVVCRIGTHKTFGGRSFCMNCNNQIPWYDMFPVASFCVLKGKCRHCESRISFMYPAVEFLTGLIFAFLFLKFGHLFFSSILEFSFIYAFYATMFSLLMVIAVYDFRHKIIPNILSVALGILSFVSLFVIDGGAISLHLPDWQMFLAGPLLAFPFVFFWAVSRGRWMGFGDAKLAISLGWILGMTLGLNALVISFWTGAFIGIMLMIFGKKYGMKSELPFAPFLVFGTIISFLFDINLIEVLTGFS